MRRSSLFMLLAAVALGLIAVFVARNFLGGGGQVAQGPQQRTVPVVVAAGDIGFGERLTPDKLKIANFPAETVPAGTFQNVTDLTRDDGRAAMRVIAANELITANSVSDRSARLSSSQLLNPTMRAVAVPINEASGVAGMVYPGDRVDVYFTRQPEDAEPYSEVLIQGARVLAVGQDMNIGKDKPEVVKAATIEVTPLQAQKVALAQTIGTVSLSLRNFTDESRVRLDTAQVLDLNDGTGTRLIPKKTAASNAGPPPAAASGPAPGRVSLPLGPSVQIIRGTEPTVYPVAGS